jgi:formate hydrogenlyase subunit 3/multisubunit Na+/H+ antiporter MnhD subunit
MHFGFALIMFGFLLVKDATGEMSFTALGPYFASHSNTIVFLTFFAGFGIKAGFIPLHTWLPKAHPAAPSHVSGIMSGVMIKMGIYGILRVTSFVSADLELIGSIVLGVGIVSGLMGVILAIMQHDLKRLLAYHSVENIGIIGIGIGLSILGMANNDQALSVLGMAGALLHCINHALFKSLLFFTAGNIQHATGTVNMDELGGLVHHARATSVAFLVGAIAISGIPPFNGFISEFLIYSGIVANFTHATFEMSLAGLASMVSLVLIGGLCVFCFTKAFGMTFLGSRRSFHPAPTHPVTIMMILPLALLGVGITLIGFFPSVILSPLQGALTAFGNLDAHSTAWADTSVALRAIGWTNVVFTVIIVGIYGLRALQQYWVTRAVGPTWGCGYSAGDFRHQYTPTSYADSLVDIVRPVILYEKEYHPIADKEVFPAARTFRTHTADRVEQSVVTKVIGLLVNYLPMAGRAQTGLIHHYLMYPVIFMVVIMLLTHFNYI